MGQSQRLISNDQIIVEGERHKRLVHIEMMGKHSLTLLQVNLSEFRIQSDKGKLIPDSDTPQKIANVIKKLRKAKRWRGIEVNAGPKGIAIQRKSKGTNMWLYDLWLAEYLLDNISAKN